jgi:hypothetical protein
MLLLQRRLTVQSTCISICISWGKIGGGGLRFQTSLSGISNSTDKEHKEKIAE